MEQHEWTDELGYTWRARGAYVTKEWRDSGQNIITSTLPIATEILRLAARDLNHNLFAAELIGALGLDRERMDEAQEPIGNQILDAVRDLQKRNSDLRVAIEDGAKTTFARKASERQRQIEMLEEVEREGA